MMELDTIGELPLWAQALIGSRMARRTAYLAAANLREVWLAGCEAMDRCATAGSRSAADRAAIEGAVRRTGSPVLYYAADAAHAAESANDFAAAETACTGSTMRAIEQAAQTPGLTPLQVRIVVAADLNVLRFACAEAGIGRYDGLTTQVMGRLMPVHPPDDRT